MTSKAFYLAVVANVVATIIVGGVVYLVRERSHE